MNDFALIGTLLTSPSAAFAELRERPRFWLPLIALTLASATLVVWYYGAVDVAWLSDRLLNTTPQLAKLPPETRARMAAAMSRNGMLISGTVGAFVAVPAVYALQAVYYLLASKVVGVSLSFKHWFTMNCWCALPSLLGVAAGAAVLLTESRPLQIDPTGLQVLSVNELFFHLPMTAKGASLLSSLSLISPLSWALTIVCVHTWTKRSWQFSATFALLPSVVWYGGWAVIAFR